MGYENNDRGQDDNSYLHYNPFDLILLAVAPQSKLYNGPFLGSLRFATQPLCLGDPTSPDRG